MKKILLDTNAYSAFLKGDEDVYRALSSAVEVFLSVIVMGELLSGFKGGSREAHNRSLLERFLSKPTVQILEATRETSEIFGMLSDTLKRQGTPIPTNDVWIAAHAMESASVLVTFDKHFQKVPGLRLWGFE